MKKLYLIFAVIFLLILSSCGLGEQPIEPSSKPETPIQSETETSSVEKSDEYGTFWYKKDNRKGCEKMYDLSESDCELGYLYTKNMTTGEIIKIYEEIPLDVTGNADWSVIYYSTGKEIVKWDTASFASQTVYKSEGDDITLLNVHAETMNFVVFYEGKAVKIFYFETGECETVAEDMDVYYIFAYSENEAVYVLTPQPEDTTDTDHTFIYNTETAETKKVEFNSLFPGE